MEEHPLAIPDGHSGHSLSVGGSSLLCRTVRWLLAVSSVYSLRSSPNDIGKYDRSIASFRARSGFVVMVVTLSRFL